MDYDIIWQPWDEPGIEHLRLIEDSDGVTADSFLLRVFGGRPVRIRYRVKLDSAWRVREADVELWDPEQRRLSLRSDGKGNWSDADGLPLTNLRGCIDIDLTATAFTNTLPIRRLGLQPGDARIIDVAYIHVPELSVEAVQQRYTCLEQRSDGARYRYEGLGTGYQTELEGRWGGFRARLPGPVPARGAGVTRTSWYGLQPNVLAGLAPGISKSNVEAGPVPAFMSARNAIRQGHSRQWLPNGMALNRSTKAGTGPASTFGRPFERVRRPNHREVS